MRELCEALAFECRSLGIAASVTEDWIHDEINTVFVVIPHEFFPMLPARDHPDPRLYPRMIALCVEHPGSQWFEDSVRLAAAFPCVVDINRESTRELRRRGIRAEQLQLGYTSLWDHWHRDETRDRPIDFLYLGSEDARRDRILAGFGTQLWPYTAQLMIPPLEPKRQARDDFLIGTAKYDRLTNSKALLNLHRQSTRATEWVRILEAMSNGCVVVSEHCDDLAPLSAGAHIVCGRAETLAQLALSVLAKPDELNRLRHEGYDFIRTELPMERGVEHLAGLAEDLIRKHPVSRVVRSPTRSPGDGLTNRPDDETPLNPIAAGLKRLSDDVLVIRRHVQRLETLGQPEPATRDGQAEVFAQTSEFGGDPPRVSVITPIFEQPQLIETALQTIAISHFDDVEVHILDDGSRAPTAISIAQALDRFPWLRAEALRWGTNKGIGAARNELWRRARGELILVLDADNGMYPTGLERLVATLDEHPSYAFAYCMLEVRTHGRAVGLMNRWPWEPRRLRRGNYIDAFALARRTMLEELGGYREDVRILGWEDFDLWCRAAEAGHAGVLVPEILAWYRRSQHSTITAMFDDTVARSVIAEASPRLFRGEFD